MKHFCSVHRIAISNSNLDLFAVEQSLPKRFVFVKKKIGAGCTTNLWVRVLSRGSIFPEILPTAAQDRASQSNEAICSFDRPMHAGLLEPLPDDGLQLAPRFGDPGQEGSLPYRVCEALWPGGVGFGGELG